MAWSQHGDDVVLVHLQIAGSLRSHRPLLRNGGSPVTLSCSSWGGGAARKRDGRSSVPEERAMTPQTASDLKVYEDDVVTMLAPRHRLVTAPEQGLATPSVDVLNPVDVDRRASA